MQRDHDQGVPRDVHRAGSARRLLLSALAVGVSAFVVLTLARDFETEKFLATARTAPPWTLGAALALYALLGWFRALRFKVLLGQPHLPLGPLLAIALLHNLLFRTFPMWTGDLSFLALTHRYLGTTYTSGLGTLLGARVFELLLVLLGGLLGLYGARFALGPGAGALFGALVLGCLGAILWSGPVLGWMAGWLKTFKSGFIGKLSSASVRLSDALHVMRRGRVFAGSLLFSACTYSTSLAFNLVLIISTGLRLSGWVSLFTITIVMLASAFPLHVSGLGVVEGSWTFGLTHLGGVPWARAVTLSFYLHGCQVLCALITGAAGYLALRGRRRL